MNSFYLAFANHANKRPLHQLVEGSYKLMQGYEGRALLYQRLILTKDTNEILELSYKLKESFIKDKIETAFSVKLKEILSIPNLIEVQKN